MNLIKLLALTAVFFVNPALAKVELILPSSTESLAINGKAIDVRKLSIDNGPVQLLFKYNANYRSQGQQVRFTSQAIILTFEGKDSRYQIKMPPINSQRDADKFNQQPWLTIKNASGDHVDYKIDTLLKEGLQIGRDYTGELKTYNTNNGIAAIALLPPLKQQPKIMLFDNQQADVEKTEKPLSAESPQSDQINVGQMLDFWYSQADEATRKAFKERINQ
ncbi:DUF2057 domain-containing protein [Shewanella colwelliana]|uniref:YccT family protein n=1 Tax=Shewanella colwelliana TaxID=23 RepID=UPI0022B05FB3|nr:DUF2057 domain-containing protein [Shewanella colwelliana]MCZ4337125.1 DUF2057 domain-containing protein [Shewanella colwelliana]